MLTRYVLNISVLCLFYFSSSTIAAQVPDISEDEIRVLEKLTGHLNKDTQSGQLLPDSDNDSCTVSSTRTALLFANSPSSHKESLFQQFSVNDYAARSKDIYNMVPGSEIIGVVEAIETKYPQITDNRIYIAIAFCAYKDQNIWFNTNKGRISAARFFRGAFLASIFTGANLDTLKITNEIDIETRRRSGF